MTLQVLVPEDQILFNDFISGHESGSFLQSWDWGSWQETDGRGVSRYLVKNDANKVLLAAQVLTVPVAKLRQAYLYLPYGPVLGDEPTGEESKNALDFFLAKLKQLHPQVMFIRLEPKVQPLRYLRPSRPTRRTQPGKTLMLDLSQTREQLQEQMHPKTRYNIKVAQRHNVQIISQPIVTPGHGLHLQEVVELITQTANRQRYKSHRPAYYRRLIDFFGRVPDSQTRLTVYKALLKQELLACGLMIDFGLTRTYLFGGTSPAQRNVMAPYLMHWQAIVDAQTAQLKSYDFWGIETAQGTTPGFVRFKLGWGGQTVDYPAPLDLVVKPLWYNAYRLLRSINRKF